MSTIIDFSKPFTLDFNLQSNSPAIDKGVDTTGTCGTDYYGVSRAAGRIDLGAVEYYIPGTATNTGTNAGTGTGTTTGTEPAVQGVAVSGVVRDLNGKGVAGVALALTGGITRTATSDDTGAYSFTDVPRISTFTITPAKDGFGFTPNCLTIATLAGDILGRLGRHMLTHSAQQRSQDEVSKARDAGQLPH
jgi:hypothetical protein